MDISEYQFVVLCSTQHIPELLREKSWVHAWILEPISNYESYHYKYLNEAK